MLANHVFVIFSHCTVELVVLLALQHRVCLQVKGGHARGRRRDPPAARARSCGEQNKPCAAESAALCVARRQLAHGPGAKFTLFCNYFLLTKVSIHLNEK